MGKVLKGRKRLANKQGQIVKCFFSVSLLSIPIGQSCDFETRPVKASFKDSPKYENRLVKNLWVLHKKSSKRTTMHKQIQIPKVSTKVPQFVLSKKMWVQTKFKPIYIKGERVFGFSLVQFSLKVVF